MNTVHQSVQDLARYRLDRMRNCSRREFYALQTDRLPQRRVSPFSLSAMVCLGMVADVCPDWLIKAQRLEADDAADLADTQNDVQYGGCQ